MEFIFSENYRKCMMVLVDADTNEPIALETIRTTFRGEQFLITGGRAPMKPGSTGKVYYSMLDAPDCGGSFYPIVFNAKWVEA